MTEQINVPKLRFTNFYGGWEIYSLKQISTKNISYGVVQTGDADLTIPCVRVINLTSGSLDKNSFIKTSKKISQSYKKTILEKDELMIALRGVIGLTKAVSVDLVGCNLTRGVARVSPNQNMFSSAFVKQALSTQKSVQRFDQLKNGSALKEISIGELNKYSALYPSLPEQQKIASFLSKVDKKIELLSKKKDRLIEYKKGVIQQLFSGKFEQNTQDSLVGKTTFIPPALRFKADDGSDFPDWKNKKFSDCFDFFTTNSLSRDKLSYEKGEVKNIHYGDIHTKFRSIFKLKQEYVPYVASTVDTGKIKADSYCKDGDLVFADASEDYADIGKCIEISELNEVKLVAGLHTHLARPKEKFAIGYQTYLQKSWRMRYQIMIIAQGSKVLGISIKQLANIVLPVPCIAEQEKIASFMISLDNKIEVISFELEKTKEWKKGLFQQMFV
jgi:type I restriction enzyme S subunit